MIINMMKRLRQVSREMSVSEGFIKVGIAMLFLPVPIMATTLVGFWLDYYKLSTLPLFSALGVLLGTLLALGGVYKIIVYGHKEAFHG